MPQLVMKQLSELENKCLTTPINFVKKTYLSKTIRESLDNDSLSMLLTQVLTKSIALSGMKERTDSLMLEEISRMFMLIYSHLTPEEIYKAFELERMRLYDTVTEHYQLFDTGYAAEILKKYEAWKLELKQKHNITRESVLPSTPLLPEISEGQKKELIDNGIKNCFEEYKQNKSISPPFSHLFKELVRRGIIPYPTEESSLKLKEWYSEKRALAKSLVEKDLKEELNNPLQAGYSRTLVQQILSQVEQNESEKIELKLHKIILEGVFQKRIDENKSIDDWLS
ncbi:hypothetical protein HX063_06045 [Myroides odoratimimus]|nr:hypothetical protein [Myroides odoratimimus]